jgi:hypothetical protein
MSGRVGDCVGYLFCLLGMRDGSLGADIDEQEVWIEVTWRFMVIM